MKRRQKSLKAKDRLDLQQNEFYERVNAGYVTRAKKYSDRFVIIDATKSIEDVSLRIWKVVQDALKVHNVKKP